MSTVILYGLLLSVVSQFQETPPVPDRIWDVENKSRLVIKGESNVNSFSCEVDRYYSADRLRLHSTSNPYFRFSDNSIVINLMEFDCGRKLLTRDFRQTLNADTHPEIVISFLTLDRLPQKHRSDEKIPGMLRITIAGVTKEVVIQFEINSNGNGTIYLKGKQNFLFSDFGLEPPTKMLGLINVKNELEVLFDLVMKEPERTNSK